MATEIPADLVVSVAAAAQHLIHKGGEGKPSVEYVSSVLHGYGFTDARDVAVRYGVADCSTAIAYVVAQKGAYAARNPGALVRWLLRNKSQLTGWQRGRVRGFLKRFRDLPGWIRERLCRWLGLSAPPAPSPRRPTPARPPEPSPARSRYPTWEEIQRTKATEERQLLAMMGMAST